MRGVSFCVEGQWGDLSLNSLYKGNCLTCLLLLFFLVVHKCGITPRGVLGGCGAVSGEVYWLLMFRSESLEYSNAWQS